MEATMILQILDRIQPKEDEGGGELLRYLGNEVVVEVLGHVGITLDSIISAPLRV